MTGLGATRIPWGAACDAVRLDVWVGCDNPPSVCAVRRLGVGKCWAEARAIELLCQKCVNLLVDCKRCHRREDCFAPTYHPELLDAPLRTRRDRNIIVGIESDPFCPGMKPEWRKPVWDMMEECYRQGRRHNFIMLTKNPAGIIEGEIPDLPTVWFGVSLTGAQDREKLGIFLSRVIGWQLHPWTSFEPSLGLTDITFSDLCDIEFAVIGGLTDGHRRVIPPEEGGTRAEWVGQAIRVAGNAGCDIFLKSLDPPRLVGSMHPSTGELLTSVRQLRQLPQEWLRLRRTERT